MPQYGAPRKLTDAQVERVITRQANRRKFLAVHGSIHDLAVRFGIKTDAVWKCIRRKSIYLQRPEILAIMTGATQQVPVSRRRRPGTPGKLTDAQRAAILNWHAESIRAGLGRGSTKRLALELGVSESSLYTIVRRNGIYKQQYRQRNPTTGRSRKSIRPLQVRKLTRQDREMQLLISAMRAWK